MLYEYNVESVEQYTGDDVMTERLFWLSEEARHCFCSLWQQRAMQTWNDVSVSVCVKFIYAQY